MNDISLFSMSFDYEFINRKNKRQRSFVAYDVLNSKWFELIQNKFIDLIKQANKQTKKWRKMISQK